MKIVQKCSLLLSALLLICHLVTSQQDTGTTSSSSGNVTSKTGRAIASPAKGSQNNKVTTDQESEEIDSDNGDSAFDNSPPIGVTGGEITFPSDEFPPTGSSAGAGDQKKVGQNRWQKIPLNALVRFGNELDISKFLQKYVANAKVARNNDTFEETLVDSSGKPLLNSRNEKVVITPAQPMVTRPAFRNRGIANDLGPSSRSGINIAATSLRMQKGSKQRPVTLSVCSPENTTVPVPITVEPHMLIIPRCVRVERCGGCCLSDIMACEPDTKDTIDVHIHQLGYIGDDKLEYVDDVVVKVERHTSCSCKCKTKKEDCFPHQVYEEHKCSCVCKNTNDYLQCQTNPNKVWDGNNCMCVCRETRECSSGLYYDLNTCECVPDDDLLVRRRAGDFRKRARRGQ